MLQPVSILGQWGGLARLAAKQVPSKQPATNIEGKPCMGSVAAEDGLGIPNNHIGGPPLCLGLRVFCLRRVSVGPDGPHSARSSPGPKSPEMVPHSSHPPGMLGRRRQPHAMFCLAYYVRTKVAPNTPEGGRHNDSH